LEVTIRPSLPQRAIRTEQGLTIEETAGRAGLNPRYLAGVERGEITIAVTSLLRTIRDPPSPARLRAVGARMSASSPPSFFASRGIVLLRPPASAWSRRGPERSTARYSLTSTRAAHADPHHTIDFDDVGICHHQRMVLARSVVAVALLLVPAAIASPAAAAIPCSKAAVAKIVHVDRQRQEAITDVRCADLNGDGRRDAAWTKFGGGSGGALSWGIVYEHNGRKVARFEGHSRYFNLRIRDRRVLIDSPIYRPGDVNADPTGGTRVESATWNGRRFVKRLVFVRRSAPSARSNARSTTTAALSASRSCGKISTHFGQISAYDISVRRISCRHAKRILGRTPDGQQAPTGWRCKTVGRVYEGSILRCTRRTSAMQFTAGV